MAQALEDASQCDLLPRPVSLPAERGVALAISPPPRRAAILLCSGPAQHRPSLGLLCLDLGNAWGSVCFIHRDPKEREAGL